MALAAVHVLDVVAAADVEVHVVVTAIHLVLMGVQMVV